MIESVSYKNRALHLEQADLQAIARQVGTPFYAYSAASISQRFEAFSAAFSDLKAIICFALKANSNQAVLTLLAKAGAGADVVSEGELLRALAAGMPADKIVFSGVGKSRREIALALDKNIRCLNVESLSELRLISEIAQENGVTAQLSVRINPDVDPKTHVKLTTGKSGTKFGISWDKGVEFFEIARDLPNILLRGIDTHIGSQITQVAAFDAAITRLVELVHALRAAGHQVDHMDLGGGLGLAYGSKLDEAVFLAAYSKIVHKHLGDLGCHIVFEPGRFIVGNAGVLVSEVLHIKPTEQTTYVVVDAAMNDLLRPTMYDAFHDIIPLTKPINATQISADIVGPVCEPGDYLARGRKIPEVKQGDLLAVLSSGAYGAVLSSTYNSRCLIPEVLVHGAAFDVVRPRPSIEALINLDNVPNWLTQQPKELEA